MGGTLSGRTGAGDKSSQVGRSCDGRTEFEVHYEYKEKPMKFFFSFFLREREGKGGRKKGRETLMRGYPSHTPH